MLSGLLQFGMVRSFQRNRCLNTNKSLQQICCRCGFSGPIVFNVLPWIFIAGTVNPQTAEFNRYVA
jgi:hypothetical protein